jgi:hypothetical protein
VSPTPPRGDSAAPVLVPMLAGATAAAAAGVLFVGWPGSPPLPGEEGVVAAAVLVTVALLLVVVPTLPDWRRGEDVRRRPPAAPRPAPVLAPVIPPQRDAPDLRLVSQTFELAS